MSEPITINRSAKAFSMRELQEWLTAIRDSKYDPYWMEALSEFWNDEAMVLVLSGQPLTDAVTRAGSSITGSPGQQAAGVVRRYLSQLSCLGQLDYMDIPKIKTQLNGDALWVWHRPYRNQNPLEAVVR